MQILILGGTGRTGKLIIQESLSRGHTITALARSPSSLSDFQSPSLAVIQGSPQNESDIRIALSSSNPPDAVIVSLSSLRKSDNPFSGPITEEGFMASVHRTLVSVIKELRLEKKTRVVTMQAFGTGDSNRNVWLPMRMVLNHSGMARASRDHNLVDAEMKECGLIWTGVRACMLSDGEKTEVRDCGDEGEVEGMGLMPKVSRKSVASFLVDVAEDQGGKWIGRTPVICD